MFGGYDEQYEYNKADCAKFEVPIASVHVKLDCSTAGHLLVPAAFKTPDGDIVPTTILVDTGAMVNFINEGFVQKQGLDLRQRKTPIRCVGFDGQEAVGGVVTEDWAGLVQLSTVDARPFLLHSSFGVTRLGSVDAIFGLPWLDRQGWVSSGSLDGGHRFTLGSTPLFVIESLTVGGKPEGIGVFSAQTFPSSPFHLPVEFARFADVFLPQTNCALPPHRDMDISINLKEGACPPFGGLYNLSFDENKKKGFIRLSSSPAAAPIFFNASFSLSFEKC
jgi:hypothetical protein